MKIRSIAIFAVIMTVAVGTWAAETYKQAWTEGIKQFKAKKYAEAEKTFAEAVTLAKSAGEKYNSMYYQADCMRRKRKFADSVKVLDELLKVEGLSKGQKDSAYSAYLHNIYRQGKKKYPEVLTEADKTIADANASNSMKLTSCYLGYQAAKRLKKYDQAIEYAKKLADYDKNLKGTWNARSMTYQAEALRYKKEYQQALDVLPEEKIAKMHPHRQFEAYMQRGYAYENMKKYPEAVKENDKAVNATDHKNQQADGKIRKGINLARIKKYPEAVAVYTDICEMDKVHPSKKTIAAVYAIEALNAAGKPEEAIVWGEKLDKAKNNYWKTRGLLKLGNSYEKQGKADKAKEAYQKALDETKTSWVKKTCEKLIKRIDAKK